MSILSVVVASKGSVGIVGLRPDDRTKGYRPVWLQVPQYLTDDWISQAVNSLVAKGATDFYFTVGAFQWPQGVQPRRLAPDAHWFRSYVMDLDCHGQEGQYPSPQDAINDVWAKLGPIDLLPTRIIFTGRGIQLFWSFDRDISAHEWAKVSDYLWSICTYVGIKADASVHRDRARVFRLPGTVNSKNGARTQILRDEPQLPFAATFSRIQKLLADNNIPLVAPEHKVVQRAANTDGEVYVCPQNEARLRYILDRLPADFSKGCADAEESYKNYRNAVWAIKRSGLPNAWDEAVKWAERASSRYDDWLEGLTHTWDSDDERNTAGVNVGTLIYLAQKYGRKRDQSSLRGIHFLDKQEYEFLRQQGDFHDMHCYLQDTDIAEYLRDEAEDNAISVDVENSDIDIPTFIDTDDDIDVPSVEDRGVDILYGETPYVPPPMPSPYLRQFLENTDYLPDPTEEPTRENFRELHLEHLPKNIRRELFDVDVDGSDPDEQGDPPAATDRFAGLLDTPSVRGISLYTIPPIPPQPYIIGRPGTPWPVDTVIGENVAWGPDGWSVGIMIPMKGADKDDKNLNKFELLCESPLELVDYAVRISAHESQDVYILRSYDRRTAKPNPQFEVAASTATDGSALVKVLADNGLLVNTRLDKIGAKMSRVLQYMVRMRKNARPKTRILCNAGWMNDNREFALGSTIITSEREEPNVKLSQNAESALGGFGVVAGTWEKQSEVLNLFSGPGHAHTRAIVSMILGSVLSKMLPNHGGVIYTYDSSTGTGKSFSHSLGLSLFGNCNKLQTPGRSSLASIEFTAVTRQDLPVYIDDLTGGERVGDRRNEELKSFFLNMSQNREASKLSRDGSKLARGSGTWNTPLFVTTNVPLEVINPDRGSSTLGTFARILPIAFRTTPLENGGYIGDDHIKQIISENYGHIGSRFIQWCVSNYTEVFGLVNSHYKTLQKDCARSGKSDRHRFHNAAIACGMVAMQWLCESGYVTAWNLQEGMAELAGLVAGSEDRIESAAVSDMSAIFSAFLTANRTGMAVFTDEHAMPSTRPEINSARDGVTIRVVGDKAWLSMAALRATASMRGMELSALVQYLSGTYGYAIAEPVPRNMTERVDGFPNQLTRVIRVPASAVISAPSAQPFSATGTDNIIPLPKR